MTQQRAARKGTASRDATSQAGCQQLTDPVHKPGKVLRQGGSAPLETTLHSTETTSWLHTRPVSPRQQPSCSWPILSVKSNQQLCHSNTLSPFLDP